MQEKDENTAVYGKNAVAELLKSGSEVDTVLLAEGLERKTAGYISALAKQAGAVVKHTRNEKLDTLFPGARHQGVAAYTAQVHYHSLEELLDLARQRGEDPLLLLADGVEDPHNLGALLRSALLCGAHGAVIPKRGSAAVTPVVLKASAGAAARLPVARVANLGEAVRRLKAQNVFVYCADMGGPPARRQDLTGPLALVVGGEGRGVSPLLRKLCDGALGLPMAGGDTGVDSFNVSVAGGILLYEIFTQRRQDG